MTQHVDLPIPAEREPGHARMGAEPDPQRAPALGKPRAALAPAAVLSPGLDLEPLRTPAAGSATLTIGFGTAVAMWGAAYVCRLPVVQAPAWLVAGLLVATLLAGGAIYGRSSTGGTIRGSLVGLISASLNLLILGSLVTGNAPSAIRPSAALFVPGFVAASMLLAALGATLGNRLRLTEDRPRNWSAGFAVVTAAATGLLLVAGGVVTGYRAGLAVTDWPNSFYYNMFLFPLSRMTGGIYYEHAHRLLGTLVGLCTIGMALHIWLGDRRRWLRWLASLAVVLVCAQGVLGGLRVTGHFTLSANPTEVTPQVGLAVLHGIVGQVFFALVVAIAAFVSSRWRAGPPPEPRATSRTDRQLGIVALALLLVQLGTGAVVRHLHKVAAPDRAGAPADPGAWYDQFLLLHLILAALVAVIVLVVGLRATLLYRDHPALRRLGRWLAGLLLLQLVLGLAALVATHAHALPLGLDAFVTTLHQGNGALLLALTTALTAWSHRAVIPRGSRPSAR